MVVVVDGDEKMDRGGGGVEWLAASFLYSKETPCLTCLAIHPYKTVLFSAKRELGPTRAFTVKPAYSNNRHTRGARHKRRSQSRVFFPPFLHLSPLSLCPRLPLSGFLDDTYASASLSTHRLER